MTDITQHAEQAEPAAERSYLRFGLILALVVLVADQGHKLWMIEFYRIAERGRVEVTPYLDLVFVINPGVSYGMFAQSSPWGQWLLAGFALVVSLGIVLWLARTSSWLTAVSLALVLGGATGNAIDRFYRGGVADFFSFHYQGFYWYIFNVADVAISVGVVGLIITALWPAREHHPAP